MRGWLREAERDGVGTPLAVDEGDSVKVGLCVELRLGVVVAVGVVVLLEVGSWLGDWDSPGVGAWLRDGLCEGVPEMLEDWRCVPEAVCEALGVWLGVGVGDAVWTCDAVAEEVVLGVSVCDCVGVTDAA